MLVASVDKIRTTCLQDSILNALTMYTVSALYLQCPIPSLEWDGHNRNISQLFLFWNPSLSFLSTLLLHLMGYFPLTYFSVLPSYAVHSIAILIHSHLLFKPSPSTLSHPLIYSEIHCHSCYSCLIFHTFPVISSFLLDSLYAPVIV